MQPRLDIFALRFEKRRQRKTLSERVPLFINVKAGPIGRELEQNAVRLPLGASWFTVFFTSRIPMTCVYKSWFAVAFALNALTWCMPSGLVSVSGTRFGPR